MTDPRTKLVQMIWASRTNFVVVPNGFSQVVVGIPIDINDCQNTHNNRTGMIWTN